MPYDPSSIKALIFDVFGTVVDWRSGIINEGRKLGRARRLPVDWAQFADDWRAGYGPAMNRVRTGELPWTDLDTLHRMQLDALFAKYGITGLTEDEIDHFNRAWHRLKGWPDAATGLRRLKRGYVIAPCSNGNIALMTNMAKHAGLPWDCILGAELAHHYKPDPEVYRTAASLLHLRPDEVMMVAAHDGDLKAAQGEGLRTAYVYRPWERGRGTPRQRTADESFDVYVEDFRELAVAMGA